MSNDVTRYANELLERGYTMIPNVMPAQDVKTAREALDELFEREKPFSRERGWCNDTYHISYMVIAKHPFFKNVPMDPTLLSFVRAVLGKDAILATLNGMSMSQGGKPQPLHLDQEQHTPGIVLNINCLHTLDDFTKANGATRVVPFTQNRKPGTPITEQDEKDAVYVEAPAGSIIAFNGGAVHAGSQNTTDKPRRCLHAYFCREWVRPHWDFKKSIPPEIAATLSEEQKKLFGWYSQPQWYDMQKNRVTRE